MFESFFAKLAGKFAAKKLNLQEGTVETKKWYLSKGVWTGIATGLLGIYATVQVYAGFPAIPEWVFALLGGLGIYSRIVADTKIG